MSKQGSNSQQPSYPRQAMVVPPHYVAAVHYPQPPPYSGPSPAYLQAQQQSGYVQASSGMSAGCPGDYYVPATASVQMNAGRAVMPVGYYVVPQIIPQQTTMIVEGGYDAGARFGTGATLNLPPPPPGCPPSTAQIAAMQGGNVVLTQKKGNWVSGGSDGGYAMW
ncbi:DAZ-associated protein 2 isoform X2 [Rhinoraja longicauda]